METLVKDIRFAARALLRQPVLSAVAVVTLMLGIGSNTAIFSVVKGVLLDSLPFAEPEELVVLREQSPTGSLELVAPPTYLDWREKLSGLEELGAYRSTRYGFRTDEEPLDLPAVTATPSLFRLLRAEAVLGRTFTEEESVTGQDRVVLLSHGLWQRQFGENRDVIGRVVALDSVSYSVVGVMGPDFTFPPGEENHLWTPLAFDPNDAHGRSRRARSLNVVGRLSDETSLTEAEQELRTVASALAREFPDTNGSWNAAIALVHQEMTETARPALMLLLVGVGFLLLIVCANVANLTLARLTERRSEVALRAALGAGRGALIRQVMSESVLLATTGGLLGLGLAYTGVRVLRSLPVANVPRLEQIDIDGGVLAFTACVSLLVALAFGLMPAIHASRPDLRQNLGDTRRSGSLGARRALSLLVAAEVAVALVLLIGSGLTVRSFQKMMAVDPGFSAENVLAAQLYLPRAKYSDSVERLDFFRRALERVRSLPGSLSAGAVSSLPMHPVGIDFALPFTIEGQNPPASGEEPRVDIRAASEDYFRTMQIPLLRGRVIDETDREDSPKVGCINETFSRRYFQSEDPIGQTIVTAHGPAEVIGVVSDVHHYGLDAEARPELYLAFSQNVFSGMGVVVRTQSSPGDFAPQLRQAIWRVDSEQAIHDVSTMRQAIDRWVLLPRLSMGLLAAFAGAALALAAIGIYGVIAYSVSLRTREMGLRLALGAKERDLVRLVVIGSMRFVALGMFFGLIAAVGLTRLLSGQLFGVSALDPAVYVAVGSLLAGIALLASFLPAWRTTKVDPIDSLRVS